jgi:large subunit ribosomal protein L1
MIEELKKGKITFKNDDTCNVHIAIGKASFPAENLKANYLAVVEAISKAKPATQKGTYIKNLVVNTSMGPSIKIAEK